MRRAQIFRQSVFAAMLAVMSATMTSAQDVNEVDKRVLELYASAEYDQALTALGDAGEPSARLYRALCLLGLGRQPEAKAVLEGLVAAAPEFTVSAEEVPPRFLALFTETRRQLLPAVLLRLFSEARERYQAKAYEQAVPPLEQIVRISSQADVRDLEALSDLRVLAEGFVDLAKAPRVPPAVVAAAAPAAGAPRPAVRPTTTPPAVVRQEIPPWPTDVTRPTAPATGTVRVQVSKTGSVISATMVRGIHPRFDARVIANPRFW